VCAGLPLVGRIAVIKVGCCGFAGARERCFRTFSVVEVQQTFYQPPRPDTLARWRREAPEAFEFTVKAWQLMTHEATSPTYRRLRARLSEDEKRQAGSFRPTGVVREAWETTRQAALALGADKVLFQCPASFQPTDENKDRMRQFFGRLDRQGLTLIWEPRGRWSYHEMAELCKELELVHCVDPLSANAATGGIHYFRLHGVGSYRHVYSADELGELARKCKKLPEVYVLFNNVSMFGDAGRFQTLIE